MDNTMMSEKKWYDKDDFASKGVAGTALGLGIGSLGLQLLNGQLGNVLGNITGNGTAPQQDFFSLYKGYRDADDAIIAKHNADSFSLYKSQRDSDDAILAKIAEINTKLAVADATQVWKDKAIYDAIALEAERRNCADNKIVGYVNQTFVPKYIAEMTVGTGTTAQNIFNPLCCGCNQVTM